MILFAHTTSEIRAWFTLSVARKTTGTLVTNAITKLLLHVQITKPKRMTNRLKTLRVQATQREKFRTLIGKVPVKMKLAISPKVSFPIHNLWVLQCSNSPEIYLAKQLNPCASTSTRQSTPTDLFSAVGAKILKPSILLLSQTCKWKEVNLLWIEGKKTLFLISCLYHQQKRSM